MHAAHDLPVHIVSDDADVARWAGASVGAQPLAPGVSGLNQSVAAAVEQIGNAGGPRGSSSPMPTFPSPMTFGSSPDRVWRLRRIALATEAMFSRCRPEPLSRFATDPARLRPTVKKPSSAGCPSPSS